MKKLVFTLLLVFSFCSVSVKSQEWEKVEFDEFLKVEKKYSNWILLFKNDLGKTKLYVVKRSIDNDIYYNFKIQFYGNYFSMTKRNGNNIMMLLENKDVVRFEMVSDIYLTEKGGVAKGFIGSAIYGIDGLFTLDDEGYEKLINNKVILIRIYYENKYHEYKIKNDDKFQKLILLK